MIVNINVPFLKSEMVAKELRDIKEDIEKSTTTVM